jgi:uncharacterized integral membrane protein
VLKEGIYVQKNQIWFIVGLLFAIIVAIFALANSSLVAVSLIFYEFEASQAVVIFFSVAVGAVITVLLGLGRHFKIKGELKKLRKENEALKKSLELQNEPKEIKTSDGTKEITQTAADEDTAKPEGKPVIND